MAISETHYRLLQELHRRGELPQGGGILEIGEAEFYGDFDCGEIAGASGDGFSIVKQIYRNLWNPITVHAIDLIGPNGQRVDLNTAIHDPDGHTYDTVINHGTAEHIFNIANVFQLMHDACKTDGLMIHESPFTGWIDHGFYCLQPTLFWDLAVANNYQIVLFALEHLASKTSYFVRNRDEIHEAKRRGQLADNLMCFVVFRKTVYQPFRVPMQGVYAGTAGDAAVAAWKELR